MVFYKFTNTKQYNYMITGVKIKELRLKKGLTQEELANRCELTKGYISQLENDLTSPSITTLADILQNLGSSLKEFFAETDTEQIVFTISDMFEKNGDNQLMRWLVPTSQKNLMEPILVSLGRGEKTEKDLPHEGEEFGFILKGEVALIIGKTSHKAKKGDSFYFRADKTHHVENAGKDDVEMIWVSCPPNF